MSAQGSTANQGSSRPNEGQGASRVCSCDSSMCPVHVPLRGPDSQAGLPWMAGERVLQTGCLCPPRVPMFNPSPQGDSIWTWGSGRRLGGEGGALQEGVSALIKENSPAPSTMGGHPEKTATYEPGRGSQEAWNLPAPGSWTSQPLGL